MLDLGGGHRFKIADADTTLRVSVSNIFDVKGFERFGSGTCDLTERRHLSVYLAADL